MAVLTGLVGALSAFYHDSTDITNPQHRHISAIRLIAKMPTLVAMAYKYSQGQPFIYPQNDLSYTGNFLRMMFATPCEEYKVNEVVERALDRIFILHADHEQNASTSTVRLCGSSGTNPFAAISAGVACLWGPAHGGANEACLQMLEELQANGGIAKVGEFMEKVKDKNSGVRLMGFGHRVYKNYDPRAKLMQETCKEVLSALGLENDPLFKLAMELERIALSDPYFVQRKLYPNVDFYSGIVQRAIGIPTSLFTAIFALARTVGWIAQWNEMLSDPDYKIGRPRQLFTGSVTRDVPRWTSADPSALAQTNPPAVAGLFGRRDQALARGVEPGGPGMAGAVRSDRERVNTNSKAYAFWQNPPKTARAESPLRQHAGSSIKHQAATGVGPRQRQGQPQSRKDRAARRRQPCRGKLKLNYSTEALTERQRRNTGTKLSASIASWRTAPSKARASSSASTPPSRSTTSRSPGCPRRAMSGSARPPICARTRTRPSC